MKPMLACDWDENKITFPVIAQPKIDGVRAINNQGVLFARSMKAIANLFTRRYFSHDHLDGLDGELAAEYECNPDLCRITTSATSTVAGEPWVMWWVFDMYHPTATFKERLEMLTERLYEAARQGLPGVDRIRIVPHRVCHNLEELLEYDNENLEAGYEGTIFRNPNGKYKEGRSTVREGFLVRIKRFVDGEAEVLEFVEGNTNNNELQTNELGYAKRSTHQENMTPNGMVGAIIGKNLADVVDPSTKKVVVEKGAIITIGAGSMPHDERAAIWKERHKHVGRISKYKTFPKGVKDKPRFPTHQTFRDPSDM